MSGGKAFPILALLSLLAMAPGRRAQAMDTEVHSSSQLRVAIFRRST